ncbi:hypothetical protein L1987_44252 [Smallanthus sonchifolius]|uniref:Uncharacterized protein n=1 Tax=Smallanthus sonchifolius TaxID=185202 RepID=A0ACB9GNC6_9ASTR|nr:hypothetical protein L1987_44252 [Smallanthus sonchifolius]
MSNFKAFRLPLISLLLFTSVVTQNSSVSASPFVHNRRFSRPDPLHHLRLYKGGYDIRNKHYWVSAAFTGIHGYAMAGIWVMFGLGFGSYLMVKGFNGGFHPFLDHPSSYFLACFALIAVFILIAIVFSSLILVANQSSLHRSKTLMDTIFGAASNMQQTIEAVMQGFLKIRALLQPYDRQTSDLLNQITNQMRKETMSIQSFVEEAQQASNRAMKAVYIANLVFVTANLVVLVTGCVILFLHWHPGFTILTVICWILTTVSWILTGFDFFFHVFAGDTCAAFEDFEQNQNSKNNGIMSILSSCSNLSTSNKFMAQIGYTVHKYIAEILSTLTCEKNTPSDICKAEGRFFPESAYGKTMAYIQSVENLIATYPDLQNLAGCTPLKHAIADVALHQCKPFRASVKLLWASILTLSIDLMILTLFWIIKAYQEKGRHFFFMFNRS